MVPAAPPIRKAMSFYDIYERERSEYKDLTAGKDVDIKVSPDVEESTNRMVEVITAGLEIDDEVEQNTMLPAAINCAVLVRSASECVGIRIST